MQHVVIHRPEDRHNKPLYVYHANEAGEFVFHLKFTDELTAQQLHPEREYVEDDPFARMTDHVAR